MIGGSVTVISPCSKGSFLVLERNTEANAATIREEVAPFGICGWVRPRQCA